MTKSTLSSALKASTLCLFLFLFLSLSAQDYVIRQLEESPRHQEWVKVKNGEREIECFLVFPEVAESATAVIVIHENRGLNDWARSMADQIAGAGYIAIAPDLLSGMGPGEGGTSTFPNSDEARKAIYELDQDQITADLDSIQAYVRGLPAANGRVSVAGFCWGGSQTFRYATHSGEITAAFVFYGTGPSDSLAYQQIQAPVYGFYGGNDNRVNATIPSSQQYMQAAGKIYEPVIYEGAGHGFMRSGQAPDADPANRQGREAAFERLKNLLGE